MKSRRSDTASPPAVAAGRRTTIAALAACATLLLVPAAAAQSQPEELWRAYPLEQSVTTGDARLALSRAAAAAAREPAQVEGPLTRETGSWTALLIATALGLVLAAGLGAVARRRAALGAVARGGPEPELFFIAQLPRAPARTAPVAAPMPMALAPPRGAARRARSARSAGCVAAAAGASARSSPGPTGRSAASRSRRRSRRRAPRRPTRRPRPSARCARSPGTCAPTAGDRCARRARTSARSAGTRGASSSTGPATRRTEPDEDHHARASARAG